MFVYVEIVHIYLKNKCNILFQGMETSPAKTKVMPAKLLAVLVTFGFSKYLIRWLRAVLAGAEPDSAQC